MLFHDVFIDGQSEKKTKRLHNRTAMVVKKVHQFALVRMYALMKLQLCNEELQTVL